MTMAARDTEKKDYHQHALGKTFHKITKYNPEKAAAMSRCNTSKQGNYTNESHDYSPNTHDPN